MENLRAYLKEIRTFPLLKPEEEITLAKRIKRHDKEAYNRMVRSNLRLVVNIAKRYIHFGIPFMDLIEEGNLGLMKAVEKFNPKKGYRFSTYAAWWIKQSITRSISEQGKIIRIPVYMQEHLNKYKKTSERLSQKLRRQPREEEIAKKMKLPVKKIREINNWTLKPASLEERMGDEGEDELKDVIEDKNSASPQEELQVFLQRERIDNLLDKMEQREKEILDLRFGLVDGTTHTLAEVSKKIGVSRERIRQIEESALKKLRKFVEAQEEEL